MKQISCPRCGQKTVYSPQNPYRPFCSERCQMIDLGNWAEGNYKVPGKSQELSNHEETELDPNSKEEDSDPNS